MPANTLGALGETALQQLTPALGKDVAVLVGYVGESRHDGYVRIYCTSKLDGGAFVDVRKQDIITAESAAGISIEGLRMVWIKSEARVLQTVPIEREVDAITLSDVGAIVHRLMAGGLPVNVPGGSAEFHFDGASTVPPNNLFPLPQLPIISPNDKNFWCSVFSCCC